MIFVSWVLLQYLCPSHQHSYLFNRNWNPQHIHILCSPIPALQNGINFMALSTGHKGYFMVALVRQRVIEKCWPASPLKPPGYRTRPKYVNTTTLLCHYPITTLPLPYPTLPYPSATLPYPITTLRYPTTTPALLYPTVYVVSLLFCSIYSFLLVLSTHTSLMLNATQHWLSYSSILSYMYVIVGLL